MPPRLPPPVLEALDLEAVATSPMPGRSQVWRVDHPAGTVVLRRHHPTAHPPATLDADLGWVHRFLDRLAPTRFPAPRQVPVLNGQSLAIVDGAIWEALTYLPGRVVGWQTEPSMSRLGAFLASFHDATEPLLAPTAQRCGSVPIDSLTDDQTWSALALPTEERRIVASAVDNLADELDRIGHARAPRSAIHGDFTNHNVLRAGQPATPSGLIDFANAYVEATLADISFALWRSGRPSQRAQRFDVERIADYVAGYHSVRALSAVSAEAIVAYLRARGLQIMAKQLMRGETVDPGPVAKLQWLEDNAAPVIDRIVDFGPVKKPS